MLTANCSGSGTLPSTHPVCGGEPESMTASEAGSAIDGIALRSWLTAFGEEVAEHRDLLTQLDSAIGDADHGANLDRGMKAVVEALESDERADPAGILKTTGMTLVSKVGGASGPLYGTL